MKTLIVIAICLLAGCQTTQEIVVVPQRTIEVIPVNASLADPTPAPSPPKPDVYMSLNRDGKEAACMAHIGEYQRALSTCNADKQLILKIQEKQQKIIDTYNQEEKRRATNAVK